MTPGIAMIDHAALLAHIERLERENAAHPYFDAEPDMLTHADVLTPENLRKPVSEPGWARAWVELDPEEGIIASAILYDPPFESATAMPGICFGSIFVEPKHRGRGLAKKLQKERFAFLDEHRLTLVGPCKTTNTVSLNGSLKSGFEIWSWSDGTVILAREPKHST